MSDKILISACLAGKPCRYDGKARTVPGLARLVAEGRAVAFCPEQAGGLPTPRLPSEIRGGRVYHPDGTEVTAQFVKGARAAAALARENGIKKAILAEKSPSCGTHRIFDGSFSGRLTAGRGITAAALAREGIELFAEEEANTMDDLKERALELHRSRRGKLETKLKVACATPEDLTLAYTPGVSYPCLAIAAEPQKVNEYTNRGNTVAVVTDGTAVLGLGDIGPRAALPVMEGKAILMKRFAGIDAVPICLATKDPSEIIRACQLLEPSFAAINLEDISAPRCVTIERTLRKTMRIPVYHDDQHGTAIVVLAALINALKATGRAKENTRIVFSGTGAAGSAIIKMAADYGFRDLIAYDKDGPLLSADKDRYDFLKQELLSCLNRCREPAATLAEGLRGADVFIGVSAPNLVHPEMVRSMSPSPIVFALANPVPEISYDDAKAAGAAVVGTGRSDRPNQINNLLAFPGIFRGLLDAGAEQVTDAAQQAASIGLAGLVGAAELSYDHIIPDPFDPRVVPAVAAAVRANIEKGK